MALDYIVGLWTGEQVTLNLVHQDVTVSGLLPYKLLNDLDILDSHVNEITLMVTNKPDSSTVSKFMKCLLHVKLILGEENLLDDKLISMCELAAKTRCVNLIQCLIDEIAKDGRDDKLDYLRHHEALKILLKQSAGWNMFICGNAAHIVNSDIFESFVIEAQSNSEWYNLKSFLSSACISCNYDISRLHPEKCKLFIDYHTRRNQLPKLMNSQNE